VSLAPPLPAGCTAIGVPETFLGDDNVPLPRTAAIPAAAREPFGSHTKINPTTRLRGGRLCKQTKQGE